MVLFDLETTGVRAGDDRVIEIGMVKVQNGKEIDRFNALINPEIPLPAFISRLTGITDHDLVSERTFAELIAEIDTFIGDSLLIAHNAAFDISFLAAEFERAAFPRSFSYACSVKLSRRLYPAQRRHGLDHIIARLGLTVENRHRALDDAFVIHHFIERSRQDHSDEQVMRHLAEITLEKHVSARNKPVVNLPEGPGVYVFEDEQGSPLYIGKSINIKKRVQDHLRSGANRFTENYSSIRTIRTTGELGALLREALMIKTEIPLYNRMLRRNRGMLLLLKETTDDGYISLKRVEVPSVSPDEFASFFGVFKSKSQLEHILANFAKRYGLCHKLLGLEAGKGSCFASQIGICSGACSGKVTPEDYNTQLMLAFHEYSVDAWEWEGPVLLTEENNEGDSEQFLIDKWCLLGSSKPLLEKFNSSDRMQYRFDFDIYKILRRHTRTHTMKITELQSAEELQLPYYLPARVSRIQGLQ
ncbi:MAG: Excinuclease cho [candidate division WS6 bacterium OLB20]|uniref:Excinuclease cho n=1 Tax=candidate division WS6 bacterium OLB20 TaxID=1617426 RepID=A0A136M0K2_9BACT|nr:MAG: Excinuclease cho [candidate division WS6 bacterium OLB20]